MFNHLISTGMKRCMAFGLVAALCVPLLTTSGSAVSAAEDNEAIALSLATLLRSARAVISHKQKHINDASVGHKGVTADFVVEQAKVNYKKATGVDFDSIDAASLQGRLLAAEMAAIAEIVDEAQDNINQEGVGLKGFLPAVFARLVTKRFSDEMGEVADIKLTAPKKYVRNRANRPDKWEHEVIENVFKAPDHETGQHVTAVTEKKGRLAFRLILPEYYKASCLACHGEPRGERDITGGKKEGGVLGELGGAISVSIFQ